MVHITTVNIILYVRLIIEWESRRSDSSGSISTVSTSRYPVRKLWVRLAYAASRSRKCAARCDISPCEFARGFNDTRAARRISRDARLHCVRARRQSRWDDRGRGDRRWLPLLLPMYNSELFKTVWTKVGRMCGYITCARSYLSGQYIVREKSPNLSFGYLTF